MRCVIIILASLYTTNLEKNKEVTLNKYPTQIEFALSPLMCNIGGENPSPKNSLCYVS